MTSHQRAWAMFFLLKGVGSSCVLTPSPKLGPGRSQAAQHSKDQRPPPPRITASMQGDPDGTQLKEARLIAASCDDNQRAIHDVLEARIAEMRRQVDERFQSWRSLPLCSDVPRPPRRQGSSGRGALGLSGIGEGGGGRGEGIGLGMLDGHTTNAPRSAHKAQAAPAAASASGTNNQVASVDEADIVKNDGRYVYIASNGALHIVEALHPRLLSVTHLPGEAREMLLEGDRAVVLTSHGGTPYRRCKYGYDCTFGGDGSQTDVVVLDVADRSNPKIVRQIGLSGSLIAARRISKAVHVVVADGESEGPPYATWLWDIPYCHGNEPVVRAKMEELKRSNERIILASPPALPTITERGQTRQLCDVMHTPLGDGQAFTSVVSFDMAADGPTTTATVQSRPGAVFVSEKGLYLATVHQRPTSPRRWYRSFGAQEEVSDIHKFHVGSTPRETRYVGTGLVPGHVLNQFSMDEWYGYLRIATSQGHVPDPNVESTVSILTETTSGNLVRVGAVEHIAPSEDIRSVRFDGDRGYVVTFKKTDPLFVLDLYHPDRPKILGELKIPGFSTYLHRIDPDHLLSIGFDAQDHGNFAYFDGIILQIFDVTQPTEPRLLHKETIGTRGSSSEAATDHLAFNYFGESNLLAIPITICEGGGDGRNGDHLTFSGLLVYDTTIDNGFRRLGGVDHGSAGASCSNWWSNAQSAVKRSIFMDDLVFSIASDRMKVQRLGSLGEDVADIALRP